MKVSQEGISIFIVPIWKSDDTSNKEEHMGTFHLPWHFVLGTAWREDRMLYLSGFKTDT